MCASSDFTSGPLGNVYSKGAFPPRLRKDMSFGYVLGAHALYLDCACAIIDCAPVVLVVDDDVADICRVVSEVLPTGLLVVYNSEFEMVSLTLLPQSAIRIQTARGGFRVRDADKDRCAARRAVQATDHGC